MDMATARGFLQDHHHAILQTFRQDGLPQMSPVACALGADGRLVVSTRATAMKVRHLRRDPRGGACVMSEGYFGEWIQVEGTVEVIELPEAMDGLVEYYRSVAGEHPDWDEYRAAMERERRVLLCMTIERAGPDRQG